MDGMDVSKTVRTFGTGGVGGDMVLPYTWHSGQQVASEAFVIFCSVANVKLLANHKCMMTLRTSGPPDSESWRRIWESATFITAMCARQGKKGLYTQLGELHLRELA